MEIAIEAKNSSNESKSVEYPQTFDTQKYDKRSESPKPLVKQTSTFASSSTKQEETINNIIKPENPVVSTENISPNDEVVKDVEDIPNSCCIIS